MKWMGKLARPAPNYGINFSLEAPEPKPDAPVKPDVPVKPAPQK
jgi:hypothetical protein